MIPPARDPRMERPATDLPPVVEPVVMFIPSPVDEPVPVDVRRLGSRRHELIILVLMVTVAVQGAALAAVLPAWRAVDALSDENRDLKERVVQLDEKTDAVEAVLGRLRQTEARIKGLTEAHGPHGGPDLPVPEDLLANHGVGALADDDGGVADPLALLSEGPFDPERLSPAQAWALDLSRRMEEVLDRYQREQPDIDELIADLESLRSIGDALPGIWPTKGEITSGFGWRRDPVHGGTRFHAGLDLANDRGTPIYAVAPGRVVRAETSSSYGRVIDIDHGYGIVTRYAHCTTLRVKEGDWVERGDFISTMGSTGKSTGPHLHFELRIDDSPHDPLKYLPR
ncbi:MAG TPA: peptidoglycan DD-metalloendopeptidase family protein [Myxococcota bacterium]|nr:peptidoglycan DD-metalloendopeptidase family protein [Myxococcota bacterium]